MVKLEDILKVLLKNGLKISPKKCQLFKNRIAIHGECHIYKKNRKICVKPFRSRLEAIQKLQLPITPKGCYMECFMGMVNFLSMFCPDCKMI